MAFPPEYIPRIDNTSTSNVIYVGFAQPGIATSAAKWGIMKIDMSSGVVVSIADGNWNLDNIWDNRTSLTYI